MVYFIEKGGFMVVCVSFVSVCYSLFQSVTLHSDLVALREGQRAGVLEKGEATRCREMNATIVLYLVLMTVMNAATGTASAINWVANVERDSGTSILCAVCSAANLVVLVAHGLWCAALLVQQGVWSDVLSMDELRGLPNSNSNSN